MKRESSLDTQSDDVPYIVLLGGGVESTYLVRHFLNEQKTVLPIYVHWGMLWEEVELAHVRRFCDAQAVENLLPLQVIRAKPSGKMSEHWALTGLDVPKIGDGPERLEIPVRNISLLRVVARHLIDLPRLQLVMGTTADNSYDDGSRAFFDEAERVLSTELSRPVTILTPLIELDKSEVIRRSDTETLAASFSCIDPVNGLHCGRCVKCGSRQDAFQRAGVADPTLYGQQ